MKQRYRPAPPALERDLQTGSMAHQAGRLGEAAAAYRRVLAQAPDNVAALKLLGLVELANGRPDAALRLLQKAIRILPNSSELHLLQGHVLDKAGRSREALACYDRAISIEPRLTDAWIERIAVLLSLHEYETAVACCDDAIGIAPTNDMVHFSRGVALAGLRRFAEALGSYRDAISINPSFLEARLNLGTALVELQRFDDALTVYDEAIAIDDKNARMHHNRGLALARLYRLEEALASFDRSISLDPKPAGIYYDKGLALFDSGRLECALANYDKAIPIDPLHADAHHNRGVALAGLQRFQEALASYDKAISIGSSDADVKYNKSLALLALGDFQAGWRLHEERKRLRFRHPVGKRHLPFPECVASDEMAGREVFLHAEQGLGDTIQFCRYIPMVQAIAASVVVAVPAPLLDLMARSFPGVCVVSADDDVPTTAEVHCPLMSLPLAFGTELATIPAPKRYLSVSEERFQRFADEIGPRRRPRVGLVWNGGIRNDRTVSWARRRDIDFSIFSALNVDDVDFFSLQKGEVAESTLHREFRRFWASDNFYNFTSELKNFDDTAALVDNLDLVIAVDTSTAHLAGALGKPVWILNRFDQCWRWLTNRTDSPWYPSARLFRQPASRTWEATIVEVRAELIRHFELA